MKTLEIEIKNEQGLHARPSSLIVSMAKQYEAMLTIKKGNITADAMNVFSIMSLGALKGDKLTLIADGKDEDELLENLKVLFQIEKFSTALG